MPSHSLLAVLLSLGVALPNSGDSRAQPADSQVRMMSTAVSSAVFDTSVGSFTIGTLLWPAVPLSKLDLKVGIDHHSGTCESKSTGCSQPNKNYGWDRAYPVALSSAMDPGTATWVEKSNLQFMVNGTYFYKACPTGITYETAECQWTAGLIVNDGRVVVPQSQEAEAKPQDALMIHKDGSVSLVPGKDVPRTSLSDVVTAIGGNILFSNGVYNEACEQTCHEPADFVARTVVAFDGLTPSDHIYFLVLQGGRANHFSGAPARAVAQYLTSLTEYKLQYGFMLDGGGSSSWVQVLPHEKWSYSLPGDLTVVDGQVVEVFRPVTTVFGIRRVK